MVHAKSQMGDRDRALRKVVGGRGLAQQELAPGLDVFMPDSKFSQKGKRLERIFCGAKNSIPNS